MMFYNFEKEAESLFGDREFLPQSCVLNELNRILCENKITNKLICENILFLMCGFDRPQLNEVRKYDNLTMPVSYE